MRLSLSIRMRMRTVRLQRPQSPSKKRIVLLLCSTWFEFIEGLSLRKSMYTFPKDIGYTMYAWVGRAEKKGLSNNKT